ncbi:MAG: hypothetical protein HY904_24540 [Deltaproteobacteria bacterium]|nr:hypothetical protein [Deltaproteobacteria bacterium]
MTGNRTTSPPGHWTTASATRTRRAAAAAAAAVLALLGLPLLAGRVYAGLDLTRVDVGTLCELRARLGEAGLLLSDALGGGMPLATDPQVQLFYPLRWLVLPLPPDVGACVQGILHLAVAAAATTWLVRTLAVRPATAGWAGVAFALCGTVVNLLLHIVYMAGAAWMPLAWAAVRTLLRRDGTFPRAALATALLGCVLGGEPQSWALCLVLCGVEVVAARHRPRAGPVAGFVALASVLSVVAGLVLWWPTLADLRLTGRSGMALGEVTSWSYGPWMWLATVAPGVLLERVAGDVALPALAEGTVGPGRGFWNDMPYLGWLLLALSAAGLGARRARTAGVVALGATVAALGEYTPVLPWLVRVLPPLGAFRYPAKYLVVATLAVVVLAAVAADRLPRFRRQLLGLGSAALALQVTGMMAVSVLAPRLDALAPAATAEWAAPSEMLRGVLWQGAVPLAAALLVAWRFPRRGRWVLGLAVLDLAVADLQSVPVMPDLRGVQSPLRVLGPEAVLCHDLRVSAVGFSSGEGVFGSVLAQRLLLLPQWNACDGMASGIVYGPLQSRMNLWLSAQVNDRYGWAARAAGCTHMVVTRAPVDAAAHEVAVAGITGGFHLGGGDRAAVYAVTSPLPPSWVVAAPRWAPDEASLQAGLVSGTDPQAWVDDPLHRLAEQALPAGGLDGVEVARVDGGYRVVTRGGAGVVAVRTAFLSGWRAWQDGAELPVVRVAGSFVGVVIRNAAGGAVDLRYLPTGWPAAPVLSVMALLGLVGACVRRRAA